MKIIREQTTRRSEEGSTLMMAVIPMIILSVALIACLELAMSRTRMTIRSQAWNTSLAMSEAGVEDAMAHLNYTEGVNLARFGYTLSGSRFVKNNVTLGDGSYSISITTNDPPTVSAQGFARLPASMGGAAVIAMIGQREAVEQKVDRNVEVRIKRVPPMIGLLSRGKVTVQNDFDADSYDSSDPAYSSNGVYSATRAKANGFIGTVSTVSGDMLVKDNAQIRGDVGSGGTVGVISVTSPASVGDAAYVASSSGLQAGHRRDNVRNVIPNISVPFPTGSGLVAGIVGGISYNWVLTNRNYKVASDLTIGPSQKMMVTGRARLHVPGTIYVEGTIEIQPGASLEIYVGSQIYVQGNGKINQFGTPDRFTFIGLSSVSQVYLQGDSFVSGVIHSPQAKLDMNGNAQFCGAGNFNDIVLQGFADFHFDEALNTNREGVFQITNWLEK